MEKIDYKQILMNAPIGYAIHRIILDGEGKPFDYEFIEVNPYFEQLTGLKAEEIHGKTVRDILPDIDSSIFNWIEYYGNITLNRSEDEFEQFSEQLQKWYRVRVFSPEPLYFTTVFTDISDKVKAKKLYEISQKKYSEIFEKSSDAYMLIENEKIIECNHSFELLLGYNRGELWGNTPWDISPKQQPNGKDSKKYAKEKIKSALENGKAIFEWVHLHKNGSELIVEVYLSVLELTTGKVIYTTLRDITERKRAERELKEQKELLQIISDNSYDLISLADLEGNFVFVNKSHSILGYEMDELLQKNVLDLIHPEDLPKILETFRKTLESLDEGREEYRYRKADGTYLWLETYGKILFVEGNPESIIFSTRDITSRKESEALLSKTKQRLQSIIEGTNVGTWEWNVQTGEVVFNRQWAEMIGYSLEELGEVSIKTWEIHTHPDDLKKCKELLEKHFNGISNNYEAEMRMLHKNGNYIWMLDRGRVLEWTEDGKPLLMSGTHQDITDRKIAEERLRESELKFRTLFETLPTGITIADKDGKIINSNKSAERILGIPVEELMRRNISSSEWKIYRPDGSKMAKKEFASVRALKENTSIYGVEMGVQKSNGDIAWIIVNAVPVPELGVVISYQEITSLKNAQNELAESNKYIESLLTAIPDMIFVQDYDYKYLDCLIENETDLLIPKEAFIGKKMHEVLDKELADKFEKLMVEVKAGAEIKYFEYEVDLPMGNKGFYNARIVKIGDNKLLTVIQNVTEQKQAQIKLASLTEQFELAINGTNDGIWDWNLQNGELFISKRWKEMLGYKDDELENKFSTFETLLYESDKERVTNYINHYLEGKIANYHLEFRMKHKSGSLVWILAKGEAVRDINGKPTRMAGSNSDISDRKKAEEKLRESDTLLRRLSQQVPGVVYLYQLFPDGRSSLPFASENIWDIYEVRPNDVKDDATEIFSRIDPQDYNSVINSIRESMITLNLWQCDYRVILPTQGNKWLRSVAKPTRQNDGSILWHGYTGDITKEKENHIALENAKLSAEAANKAKSEFLANMSHEIRTPLNGVIGFTELMLETNLNETQHQYLENIHISGRSLLTLISDILDFSKIEAGKLELEIVKTDITYLLDEAIDIVRFQADRKGLELILNFKMDLPEYVLLDPIRLRQILVNLLSNAIKFTNDGEVELRVDYEPIGDERGKYTFFVRDTGIGITEDQKSKLFKAFSQADSSTTRKFGGTGLGLIISNMLAQKMGSEIQLTSTEGDGSTFYFSIECETEFKEKYKNGLKAIKRVLLVDDNDSNLKVLEMSLKSMGIAPVCCETGFDTLKILDKDKDFDALIIDYNMPYLNGIETVRKIREELLLDEVHLPAILLQGSSNEMFAKQCKEYRIAHNLRKPIRLEQLRHALRNLKMDESTDKILLDYSITEVNNLFYCKKTILIVEDNDMNMMLLTYMIKQLAPEIIVVKAKNGLEALEIVELETPHLILMDVQMPELDGIEATKKIREFQKKYDLYTPIVALTAGALKSEEERCLAAGMDDFMTKPIERTLLVSKFEKYLLGDGFKVPTDSMEQMADDADKQQHFNKDDLMLRIDNDKELFAGLLSTFFEFFEEYLKQLDKAISEQNFKEIKSIAHTIKGSALNMSFDRLAILAKQIEKKCDEKVPCISLYEEIKKEYIYLKAKLKK